jgi:hypothetical protein
MNHENVVKLRQAFPKLFSATRFECGDNWYSLLLTLGARLERALRASEEREVRTNFVEVVLETSQGLDFALNREDASLNHVLDGMRAQSRVLQRGGRHPHPYLWTHTEQETTESEEVVRAERSRRQHGGMESSP